MQKVINSRRNFLGIMAVLTSGTVVAGSPLCLLEDKNDRTAADPETAWQLFMANYQARLVMQLNTLHTGIEPVEGLRCEAGNTIYLPKENILAVPTWIYWANSNKPNDVLVSFFENDQPHKKIKTINRFELAALSKLSAGHGDKELLQQLCLKACNEKKAGLHIFTSIQKGKPSQNIVFYKDNRIVLKEQLFYNA